MKNLILIFIIFFSSTLFAQVVLTADKHLPVAGDKNVFVEYEIPQVGGPGRNQIWDFSALNTTGNIKFSYFNQGEKNLLDEFNIRNALVLTQGKDNYYHQISKNNYSLAGFSNQDYMIYYDKPIVRLKYPFAFTDIYESDFAAKAISRNGTETEITGNYKIEADAYGTVILPGNNINALRIKIESLSVQVSRCREVRIHSIKYLWYSDIQKYPVASLLMEKRYFCDGKETESQFFWINQNFLEKQTASTLENTLEIELSSDMSVFPNPLKDEAQIRLSLFEDSYCKISLKGVAGNHISEIVNNQYFKAGTYYFMINKNQLSLLPGVYLVELYVNNQKIVKKIVLQ
ncbi:MAG TPA: hypothetical protein P5538_08315 [Bacteroidales bacterium]|jgi:hypothetical protein|nr:hypothetical protein [Bacteroidales bacterium]HOL98816.1 hypothetical protein [Bacteroidales bacterium]HOM37022.1 hypothetical protein [Bacteroidales bacterium]HPD24647.1 hypothetical protein [Bacteroidales bacterium]HRT00392.1 hypothetical protein [Bacteroidales bacterium]